MKLQELLDRPVLREVEGVQYKKLSYSELTDPIDTDEGHEPELHIEGIDKAFTIVRVESAHYVHDYAPGWREKLMLAKDELFRHIKEFVCRGGFVMVLQDLQWHTEPLYRFDNDVSRFEESSEYSTWMSMTVIPLPVLSLPAPETMNPVFSTF